ncbi:MAG: glucuronate isomerase [Ahrensia sp.]
MDSETRSCAAALFAAVEKLPIISPHGHTDPRWFAENAHFENATSLLITPDHYVLRMLISQGISMQQLGFSKAGQTSDAQPHDVWQLFAENYHLFRGTPSRMWLDHTFATLFDLSEPLNADTARHYYDTINEKLADEAFRPRALFERFNIEAIATTESALDDLSWHKQIAASGWSGRVITTYRPDSVIDPDFEGFADNIKRFGALTGCDVSTFDGYIDAHRQRRAFFRQHGATATDHGHPSASTADLLTDDAAALYQRIIQGNYQPDDAELFRGQMLTEMARLSVEDGMVMQLHPGSHRNHHAGMMADYGRDKGFDIPTRTDYVSALKPLLNAVGMQPDLTIIMFTLDETAYARELAPLAGAYPCLKLGPAWWFHDSPEGMMRYRQQVTETAGFYNTVGFNDDTRAFCSIPARHDVARRVDCAFLAQQVGRGILRMDEAHELAWELAYGLAKKAYKL